MTAPAPYRKTKATPLCHCRREAVGRCNTCSRPLCAVHEIDQRCGYCRAEARTQELRWGPVGAQLIVIGAAVVALFVLLVSVPQTFGFFAPGVASKLLIGLGAGGALAAGLWPALATVRRDLRARRLRRARKLLDARREQV